ncbi:MAG: hypothetical protein ABI480_08505 [Chitinophagaceae bacterium]
MKVFFLATGILACSVANSQTVNVDQAQNHSSDRVFYTAGGAPFSSTKYTQLTGGSPYFSETWMKGAIETYDSLQYPNILSRLDLVENTVIYLNPEKQEMVSIVPINRISLHDTISGQTYLFVHLPATSGASDKIWYQQLSMGKVSLYKQYFKDMRESKAYGSSITEQSINTDERYFLMSNGALIRVKKLKDISDLVPAKKQQIDDFVKAQRLSGKKDGDFVMVMEYINSL